MVAGTWAVLYQDAGQWIVRQGGPGLLWDDVEAHVTRWRSDGSPGLEDFEVTVTPEGQTVTWSRV